MADINYEIIEELGVLSSTASGWQKELNFISWNEGEPKYDIRQWGPDHQRMGKGISLVWMNCPRSKSRMSEFFILH